MAPAARRSAGQRAAIRGLWLLPDAAAFLEQLTAFELFQRLGMPERRPAVEAEIEQRRGLDPVPGSTAV